jgi:putative nucleotidyltransferase with HDIG domain
MTLLEKLSDVRDFRKILETTVKEIGENYSSDVCQIILSNPLDSNFTSICEYVANPDEEIQDDLPFTSFPVHLEGGGLGLLNVSREKNLSSSEVDEIRITLANIADILRYAQINDLVQRDTFRSAFMSEITNLMSLQMGLGDALFMVVNILGKALDVSRCIFVCVDDSHTDWRAYEYWKRERIEPAQTYGWPTKDSAIISQTLLSPVPIESFEGQQHSYKTPVQEEMEFIGVRSQLSVAIRSGIGVHGAIVLQQCESRHAWTRDEIDIAQSVADTVAEALAQLPDEKKELEPIMRLHQHEVAETKPEQQSMQEVRKAVKSALRATTAIAKAKSTKKPEPPAEKPRVVEAQLAEPLAGHAAYDPAAAGLQAEGGHAYGQESVYTEEAAYANEQSYNEAGQEYAYSQEQQYQQEGYPAEQYNQDYGQEQAAYNQGEYSGQEYSQSSEEQNYQQAEQQASYEEPLDDISPDNIWGESGGQDYQNESPSIDEPQLEGLSQIIEEQAQQIPSEDNRFKGVLGNILKSGGGAARPAWDVPVTQEQPPPPPGGDEPGLPQLPPAAKVTPVPPTMPSLGANAFNELAGSSVTKPSVPLPGNMAAKPPSKWGDLDSIPTPGNNTPAPSAGGTAGGMVAGDKPAGKWDELASMPAPPVLAPQTQARGASKWGDLDSIPTPGAATKPPQDSNTPSAPPVASPAVPPVAPAAAPIPPAPAASEGAYGNLDAIPTPAASKGAGLGSMMMGMAKASAAPVGGLGASFHKGGIKPPAPPTHVEGPPIQIDEAAAEAKLKQILASSNPTSDYIFATPGVDMRLLGRIDGYVSQVEAKDKHVNGHVRAVAEYSTAVARLLGLNSEDVNTIRLAAILHDVGKMALPKDILQKPDESLSDAELVKAMNHPIDGAKLVEGFPELAPLAPIILSHHEEFDGQGYPEGKAGEEIPLGARIIFACNAYVEMVTDLVYRAGMPPEQAQNHLIRGANSTYDPNVVEALIACISQGVVPPVIV